MKRVLLLLTFLLLALTSHAFAATVEGRLVQSLDLSSPPLDVSLSPDGQRLFVLEGQKLVLYTIRGELLGEYPLEKKVRSIKAQGPSLVLLYGSDSSQIDYLYLEVVYPIQSEGAPIKGPADAPVTIAVFDDFQCPYCAQLAPVLKQVQQLYPDQVRTVFKNFPLGFHPFARPAALAALAAERQGKFWDYHDMLFARSKTLNAGIFEELATSLKLDLEKFKKDLADPDLAARVDQDMREAQEIGVGGTPAVYINGRQLQDRSLNGFRGAIEAALRVQKTQ